MSPESVPQLTTEQSATIARTLYEPTIRRMNILCQSLITTTSNGDFALWAPLTVMQTQLADLKWGDTFGAERFLALIALTLRRFAEKCEVYQLAVAASRTAGAAPPPFPVWTDDDTIAVYTEIDARFPNGPVEDPADPAAPPAPAAPEGAQ